MLMHIDPVQCPGRQGQKEYSEQPDLLAQLKGEGKPVPYHVAKSLCQVKNSGIPKGGWTGGDAWFGSVSACCVHLKRIHGVESIFVVKGTANSYLFPQQVLQAVMRSRHPEYPQGKWVVMTTEIQGVKLTAICYAWSKHGLAYFITTMGNTRLSIHKYKSRYQGLYGEVVEVELDRPEILHFVFVLLPLIDNHNKLRQAELGAEKSWPTKDAWTKLFVAIVGMAVVDLFCLY